MTTIVDTLADRMKGAIGYVDHSRYLKDTRQLTNPVEVLADLSGDGQTWRNVYTTPSHLAKVGPLASKQLCGSKENVI